MNQEQKPVSSSEVYVLILFLAVAAALFAPIFVSTDSGHHGSKSMSNAKQIGLLCKQFALDYDGKYPAWPVLETGLPDKTVALSALKNSNVVLACLFPNYTADE